MARYTFRELQKAAKKEVAGKELRIVVLGNTATQFFSAAVAGSARLAGLNAVVHDADYDQIDAQLLDTASETYVHHPEDIILYLSTQRLYEDFLNLPFDARHTFAEDIMERITHYWDLIRTNCNARILQMNFTALDDKVMGQFSAKVPVTFTYQLRRLNALLQQAMEERADVYPVDLAAVQLRHGADGFFDARLYYTSKVAVSMEALPDAAQAVTDVLLAMQGRVKKCIVLDLDNTLWGGVVADEGLDGIEIGSLGKGHAYTDLQRWLKQLKECGILLTVCSKNDEAIAKEPFEKHEDMVLRLSDIALFVANWEDKATNIRLIQETLNIGMDSIVFLDDNPFERELVRSRLPEVTVPDLPEDPAHWLTFLQEANFFETASFTGVSEDRTSQYKAEFERRQAQASYASIDDYLESLNMTALAHAFDEEHMARIAQLTQRSNQFNLRTVRYTEDEIARLMSEEGTLTRYYTLQDKFGVHGLIGLVILKKKDDQTHFIDTWIMSCRVLKRTMEAFILNDIVALALGAGDTRLEAEYLATPKNGMVAHLYDDFGFTAEGEGRYSMELSDFTGIETFICTEQT